MSDATTCFTLNDGEVAAKVIDGEAILINLSTGVYYSLDKTGAVIWEYLSKRYSLETIERLLLAKYDATPEQVRADLANIIAELCNERVVFAQNDGAASPESGAAAEPAKERYESPQLQTYNDMGDLLALDPPMPKLRSTPWTGEKTESQS